MPVVLKHFSFISDVPEVERSNEHVDSTPTSGNNQDQVTTASASNVEEKKKEMNLIVRGGQ